MNKIYTPLVDTDLIETRITRTLETIDDIKSVFAGRNLSFAPYTHTTGKDPKYSKKKTNKFSESLLRYIEKYYKKYSCRLLDEHIEFYKIFFVITFQFCELYCNPDDWIFESILKISKTINREGQKESVFDIMIRKQNSPSNIFYEESELSNELLTLYKRFNEIYEVGFDEENFLYAVRFAINEYLDENMCSYYVNKNYYLEAIFILENTVKQLAVLRYSNEE